MPHLLLTGGGGAIGSGISEFFRSRGFDVTAPRSSKLDLSQESSPSAFFKTFKHSVDVFIHAAGVNNPKPIESLTVADWNQTMDVNTRSFFLLSQLIAPSMKRARGGTILAISSLYGSWARSGRLPYVGSKHALNGLVKTMALEWGPFNIKVNSLSPGFVDTPMTRKNNDADKIRSFEERIPLGRLATPDDIARTAFFLCSNDNTYLTGQDIVMDGGYSAGGFQP